MVLVKSILWHGPLKSPNLGQDAQKAVTCGDTNGEAPVEGSGSTTGKTDPHRGKILFWSYLPSGGPPVTSIFNSGLDYLECIFLS